MNFRYFALVFLLTAVLLGLAVGAHAREAPSMVVWNHQITGVSWKSGEPSRSPPWQELCRIAADEMVEYLTEARLGIQMPILIVPLQRGPGTLELDQLALMLPESVATRLSRWGFRFLDATLAAARLPVQDDSKGSEEVKPAPAEGSSLWWLELAQAQQAEGILTGLYTYEQGHVSVQLRVIRTSDLMVIASSQFILRSPHIFHLRGR